jgi:hypothetical protein
MREKFPSRHSPRNLFESIQPGVCACVRVCVCAWLWVCELYVARQGSGGGVAEMRDPKERRVCGLGFGSLSRRIQGGCSCVFLVSRLRACARRGSASPAPSCAPRRARGDCRAPHLPSPAASECLAVSQSPFRSGFRVQGSGFRVQGLGFRGMSVVRVFRCSLRYVHER